MQISILSEKKKALKNFIFYGCKEKRGNVLLDFFFLIFMAKFSLGRDFFTKFKNVILQRPLAVQMKSSDWRSGFGYYFTLCC